MKKDPFVSIRPYENEELPYAINRILTSEGFIRSLTNFIPNEKLPDLIKKIRRIKTCGEMQREIFAPIIDTFIQRSIDNLTYGGFENLDKNKSYLFIANHRDIILDSALLQVYLFSQGLPATKSAIGDNLLSTSTLTDIAKICNMFTVFRGNSTKTMLANTRLLSEYIRHSICNEKASVWIAQRGGRTKDGFDKTQQGILKMLYSSDKKKGVFDSLAELNIVPIVISYEFEPCDQMKAREILLTKQNKTYVKARDEDFKSITTGIFSYKSRVHLHMGEPINNLIDKSSVFNSDNERLQYIIDIIDRQMYKNYRLWPNNHIAYDILNNTTRFQSYYSEFSKRDFLKHIRMQANIDDVSFAKMKQTLLEIYANPVNTFLSL